ncbi:MAG: hypothetical protein M0Z85_08115 [Gammaproteobacteria bacterium]|nr:hypothetical protein [Gammaproteobacteria bacterium]
MPNILTRAQRLVELSEKATDGLWIDVPELGKVLTVLGETPYTIMEYDANQNAEDIEFIAAARNDGPAIAQALVEALDILTRLDQHMDFSIPWQDEGVCDECGNGYEDASGVNKAMGDARDFLARMEGTLDA